MQIMPDFFSRAPCSTSSIEKNGLHAVQARRLSENSGRSEGEAG